MRKRLRACGAGAFACQPILSQLLTLAVPCDTGGVPVRIVRKVHLLPHLNVSKAREQFPEVVNRAAYGKERTIVSRRGKDMAAVIPMDDLRLLERLAREEMDRLDLKNARAALKEAKKKGTIRLRDLMRERKEVYRRVK